MTAQPAQPTLSALVTGICDDAALFPPGNAPLAEALPARERHLSSAHADLVGPFVFPAGRLPELAEATFEGPLEVSLTVPGAAALAAAVADLAAITGTSLAAVELAPGPEESAQQVLQTLDAAALKAPVFVEIPRDDRRADFLTRLAGTAYSAKFRTGGVTADKYPDGAELASAVRSVVAAGIPFKATAGLHHAVRNTDPDTGFEQHGFLNILLATHRALQGADENALAETLAGRDGAAIAAALAALDGAQQAAVRHSFQSFGTCSITDPLGELTGLGLIPQALITLETEGTNL
ncbi:hypothetical protein [Tomitella biformata]|uniref:hypothetical protein n=1 Tax=Tomitella biformata TaxID=630403 RepID=UPI00056F0991|nr:hypothetical protein [Tomitella biformata]